MNLASLLPRAAARHADRPAVANAARTFTYRELDEAATRLARLLMEFGVAQGDRVGLWAEKSPLIVAAMQAALRLGAAYVPVDPTSPAARAAKILQDCSVAVVVTTPERAAKLEGLVPGARVVLIDDALVETLARFASADLALPELTVAPDDLAYILYTSGSTGQPKGVCISHRNALAFIEWAVEVVGATEADRFANHAPFSFDLSVLDLYAAFSVGASVWIIPEGAAYSPAALVAFIQEIRPTVWYSVPSALILMMEHGRFLELEDSPIRVLLFAGEPFPIRHLSRLRQRWPSLRLLNLYGPTETNVCTFHEVGALAPDRTRPVPIGRACSGDSVWVAREDGTRAGPTEEGVLMVEGPTVMLGYWGQPPQGNAPYATGDVVRLDENGDYEYLGRRDNMVKVRGFRIELSEIEAVLAAHPAVRDVIVVVTGAGVEARLTAVAIPRGETKPSILELKQHSADRLPRYMILDRVRWTQDFPRSPNGKIDRRKVGEDLERAAQ